MTLDERPAPVSPDPRYDYGGYHVRIEPTGGSPVRWRVVDVEDEDRYFGELATAEPVKGEPEIHFAAHFPDEEDIPPTKIVADWRDAVEFLLDAGKY
ncbi:hypothetical protein P5G50_05930 [Leifsonia sp. F6_8S_P_1B]|uniref:Uncharacterized protein n=1 Tax=Leifsonia williamsii TaxID=3035919 RepID=A0ABT8K949_9MICO|nr:hypothetical protein [Leifsonia williamsii]MDN4613989.1 hypothetical protein [Leifsonia williamsii]